MNEFNQKYRVRFEKLSTTNVSDAMDALGYSGATYGIRPMSERWGKVLGPAVTVKVIATGLVQGKHHLGVKAIAAADSGDVIIIDNGGRIDISCWGGILANGAKVKGVNAVVIDGVCRDLDDCLEINLPIFARGTVVATARGRAVEESTNEMIQFGGVQVSPGDIIMGDRSGVVVIPVKKLEVILDKAEALWQKEENMIRDIQNGEAIMEVDQKYNYEMMLSK